MLKLLKHREDTQDIPLPLPVHKVIALKKKHPLFSKEPNILFLTE